MYEHIASEYEKAYCVILHWESCGAHPDSHACYINRVELITANTCKYITEWTNYVPLISFGSVGTVMMSGLPCSDNGNLSMDAND